MSSLVVCQLLLFANWNTGHSKPLFDGYYGGMTQLIEQHSRLFHFFKIWMKDFHARLSQMPLINLENCLSLLSREGLVSELIGGTVNIMSY